MDYKGKLAKTALIYTSLTILILLLLFWPYDEGGLATINGFKNKVNINYRYMFLYDNTHRDNEREDTTKYQGANKGTVIKSLNIVKENVKTVPSSDISDSVSINSIYDPIDDRDNQKTVKKGHKHDIKNEMINFKDFSEEILEQSDEKSDKNDEIDESEDNEIFDEEQGEITTSTHARNKKYKSNEDDDEYSESEENTTIDPRHLCDEVDISQTLDKEHEDYIDRTYNKIENLKYSEYMTSTESGQSETAEEPTNTDTQIPFGSSLMSGRVNYNPAHRIRRKFEIKARLTIDSASRNLAVNQYYPHSYQDKRLDQEKYFELAEKVSNEVSKNNADIDENTFNPWEIIANWVDRSQVTPARAPTMGTILDIISDIPVTGMRAPKKMRGSTMKLILELEGGQQTMFKPKRLGLDNLVRNRFWPAFHGKERYNCEIAGFHLSRILNFRRTAIVVGRKLHVTKDLLPVDELNVLRDIENAANGTFCFRLKKKKKKLCTQNGPYLEGALILWLPYKLNILKNPWHPKFWDKFYKSCDGRQMYDITKASCKLNIKDSFKSKNKKEYEVTKGISTIKTLLDVIDTAIYDFILDNIDRSSFEYVVKDPEDGPDQSSILMIDSGNCFPDPRVDTFTTLAPLYQCCMLRQSTFDRLVLLRGNRLSTLLNVSMSSDKLSPILTEPFYKAINRRMQSLMTTINWCFDRFQKENVLMPEFRMGEPLMNFLF